MSISADAAVVVRALRWAEGINALRQIREAVFVQEQQVPVELEWDDEDEHATHFLAQNQQGIALGCARFLATGQIGRMAVLADYRGQGIGAKLLLAALEVAKRQNFKRVWLHAQLHALPFYEKQGFVAEGDIFDDAGIPHRLMRKNV